MAKDTQIENAERRKAVKTIVGGVTAVAAYNLLPAKWGTPIIESVLLPAHAATSGTNNTSNITLIDPCDIIVNSYGSAGTAFNFNYTITVNGYVSPAIGGLATTVVVTPFDGPTVTGTTTTAIDGTFSISISGTMNPWVSNTINVTTSVSGASGIAHCSNTRPSGL